MLEAQLADLKRQEKLEDDKIKFEMAKQKQTTEQGRVQKNQNVLFKNNVLKILLNRQNRKKMIQNLCLFALSVMSPTLKMI